MQATGFVMLAAVAALALLTGLPMFAVMIGVTSVAATFGVVAGAIPMALLTALPTRIVGLLETDLLQALPLYILMGSLLNRLPLADILFRVLTRALRRTPAAPLLAGLTLGGILAPMNGSVGASVVMLTRIARPRVAAHGVSAPVSLAAICAASTLGVVVPPSLVLILLGDAMMRAHTEALNESGQMIRVINTADVFRGAMLPALLLFGVFLLVTWRAGRHQVRPQTPVQVTPAEVAVAALTVASIGALLGLVAFGYLYAVEAAAAGAVALYGLGLASGVLRGEALRGLLTETAAVSGALFALFLAATSFTLVFRAFGSDRVLSGWVTAMPGGVPGVTVAVLGFIGMCALVLDAFEIILVIVPLLMPAFLLRAPDAVWASVLVLLVLQGSFLLPPFGYAVMLTRSYFRDAPRPAALVRALVPYVAGLLLVLACVAAFPGLVHLTSADDPTLVPTMSDAAARQKLLQMTLPTEEPSDDPVTIRP